MFFGRAKLTKADRILARFRELNVWRRGEERAPHKPLLVLLALAKLQAGAPRLTPFDEVENPLSQLLEDFGPRGDLFTPSYRSFICRAMASGRYTMTWV